MDRNTAILILRILGPSCLVAVPKTLFFSLLRGLEEMGITNTIEVLTTALQQFGVVLILYFNGDLLTVVYWYSGCYFLRLIMYMIISSSRFGWLAFLPGYFHSVVKRNYNYTSRLVFAAVANTINMQIDKWVITTFMPIAQVGYYGLVNTAFSRSRILIGAVSQAAFPSFSALHAAGERDILMRQYHKMQDIVSYSVVPMFALLIYAFHPLFSFVFNADIARELFVPGLLLCLSTFLQATLTVPYIFALATGNSGITAKQKVFDLIIVPPLAIAFTYWWGLVGAALSIVILNILHIIYGLRRTVRECLKFGMWDWYFPFIKVLTLFLLCYGVPWLIIEMLGDFSLVSLLIGYIAGSCGFCVGGYLAVHEETRKAGKALLLQILNKAGFVRARMGD